ncbi:MAG: DUF4124 domain-containing protein [Thiobacillus sp.]
MRTDGRNCRRWRITAKTTASRLLAVALALAAGGAQAGMYRWVDGNGRVQYSDTPPTTFQSSGGVEMSKQGNVVKRTQSEAERRAEAERMAERKRIEQARQRQAQLDRALMSTYTSEAEIDLARDRALEHHKLAIKGARIRAQAVEANLKELRGRIAAVEKSGRPVGPGLKDQLVQAGRESRDLKRTVENNEEAMAKVRERYAADKARFRELTGQP